jgi:hypothetical protein
MESARSLGRRGWSRLTHELWKDDNAVDKITRRTPQVLVRTPVNSIHSLAHQWQMEAELGIHCLRIEYAKA